MRDTCAGATFYRKLGYFSTMGISGIFCSCARVSHKIGPSRLISQYCSVHGRQSKCLPMQQIGDFPKITAIYAAQTNSSIILLLLMRRIFILSYLRYMKFIFVSIIICIFISKINHWWFVLRFLLLNNPSPPPPTSIFQSIFRTAPNAHRFSLSSIVCPAEEKQL